LTYSRVLLYTLRVKKGRKKMGAGGERGGGKAKRCQHEGLYKRCLSTAG
jgi:hypothetical protein